MKKIKIQEAPSGIHTWLVLWKTARAVEICAHRSIQAMGLGVSDFAVMEALLHKGSLPVNVIGSKVLLTSSSMTAAVDRLEAQGLVERHDDPSDRRARLVSLTKKGARMISTAFRLHAKDMELLMAPLEEEERTTLVLLLRKLGRNAAQLGRG
jgi:MarR family 2-MHQ and catechol resistance regulon transcriptional repressor